MSSLGMPPTAGQIEGGIGFGIEIRFAINVDLRNHDWQKSDGIAVSALSIPLATPMPTPKSRTFRA
jgi:hypothetical protein